MKKQELLKYIGSVEQIGGIRDYTYNDGKSKGVRAIEVNTGNLRFTIFPDRCMDIGQAYYKGTAVSWFSKTGVTAPEYYEPAEKGWLRGFYGGLITTCGFRNIGRPYGDMGLHGRLSHIPASKVSVFADWVGDEYVMKISGEVRESVTFGENLVLKRTITTKLFSDQFTVEDTIENQGFKDVNMAYCYHCNFGYPLVNENCKIVGVPEELSTFPAPTHGVEEECLDIDHTGDIATAGIENGEIGAYITYKRDTLPKFLLWKLPSESDYTIGLEPRTTNYGGENIEKNGEYVVLKPFEEYKTHLEFSFKTL